VGEASRGAVGGRVPDDLAGVHDRQPVADLEQQRQVMGDEQHSEPELLAQPLDLLEDLALHDDVEGCGRLVHDHHLRAQGQGHRDHDPLAHAARQLVREATDPRRVDADHGEQFPRALEALRLGHVRPVCQEDVVELLAEADHRVEGVHGRR
jgi:hypothetical protein